MADSDAAGFPAAPEYVGLNTPQRAEYAVADLPVSCPIPARSSRPTG